MPPVNFSTSSRGRFSRPRYFLKMRSDLAFALLAALLAAIPTAAAPPILSLTATTENVAGAPDSIRIELLRWSTDAERDQLLSAWTNPEVPATAGRGGRGGGRGGDRGAEAARPTPESSLKAALGKAATVGYLWSSEVTGYAVRYAVRLAEQGGGERIILVTDRRLGDGATGDSAINYDFSLIELRFNAKQVGEGKISLRGKIALDASAKTLVLENYGAIPVVLKNVKKFSAISGQQK